MKRIQLALAALAAGQLGLLGWLTDWGRTLSPSVDLPAKATAKADVGGLLPDFRIAADATAYAAVAERPLLNPTRRPAPTAPVAVATEPPKPQIRRGLYQLVGISDFGLTRVAQVREIATNVTRSVRVGDMLQELRVEAISADSVRLTFAGETDLLTLPKFTASGRVPQPPAPPTPPSATPTPPQAAAPPAAAQPASPPTAVAPPASPMSVSPAAPIASPVGAAAPPAGMAAASPEPGSASGGAPQTNREWARMRALRAGVQPQ